MKSILPYSILIPLTAACVPSGEFVDFKDGDFNSVESATTTNTDALAALEARLTALEEQNTSLQTSLTAAEDKISALESENSQLQTDLSIANDNIGQICTTWREYGLRRIKNFGG